MSVDLSVTLVDCDHIHATKSGNWYMTGKLGVLASGMPKPTRIENIL